MYAACIIFIFSISINMVYISGNTTESTLEVSTTSNTTLPAYLEDGNESLSTCFNSSVQPGGYELQSDGNAFIKEKNITLNETLYVLINDTLRYCSSESQPVKSQPVPVTAYLTLVGAIVSIICLFLHLSVFALVPDLRNQPGWNLAALSASLFISYLFIFLSGFDDIADNQYACTAVASIKQFFLLASFLWMSLMSLDVFMTIRRSTRSFRITNNQFRIKKFGVYCLCAFGIALLFTICALAFDILDIVPQRYKPRFNISCWFSRKMPLLIFFAGPAVALPCINMLLFGLSACMIHANKRSKNLDAKKSVVKRRYLMYFRLSVIMGITWILGLVANIVRKEWVWILFVLLNTLQGLFIFLVFTCTKKVKKYILQKFPRAITSSQQTLTTPTFQSYLIYEKSTEQELKQTVESSNEKLGNITIHL